MILKDLIKNSGVELVYIIDTKRGNNRKSRLYTFDLTYPPDTIALKEFLEDYGHSLVLYGATNIYTNTVTAHI